jgi:hypothetical protein
MPDQHDLAVPTYIDTNSLLDLLASLEGGFSMVERLSSQESSSGERKTDVGGEFGVANVLNLLKLNVRAARTSTSADASTEQSERERYHTYGSLLYRLRGILTEEALIRRPSGESGWDEIGPSDFVELHGVFRPNPLADSFSTLLRIIGIAEATITMPDKPKNLSRDERLAVEAARAAAQTQRDELEQIRQLLQQVLDDIQSSGSRIFIVELGSSRRAVVRLFPDFARDPTLTELAHGEYKLLGKVVRNLSDTSGEAIDLLQGTALGGVGRETLDELLQGFQAAEQEGLKLPEIRTSVEAPALQVVPIGIYV